MKTNQKISFLTLLNERPVHTLFLITSLSLIMIIVGLIAGNKITNVNLPVIGFSELNASTQIDTTKQIIRLDRERLSGKNLGKYAPYEPEHGDLIARGHDYFYSLDGNFGIGVWESKPGTIKYKDLAYDELMYVLDGSMVMTDENGKIETYSQGEGLVLPKGWSGTLTVPEGGVRKIWVSYMAGVKGS